ncbi:MAG: DUF167 domain-containing protein [Nitratireductor sp.]|nr:DUF167 domain-containing protein [Nitratireductor sp.]
MDWYRITRDGLELFLRVTPRSSRDTIEGLETADDGRQRLKLRIRAVPEDGKANKAVIALLAKAVGMPKSSVALGSGSTGRNKSVVVACSFEKATAMVERLTSSLS